MTFVVTMFLCILIASMGYYLRFAVVLVIASVSASAFTIQYALDPALRTHEQTGLPVTLAWCVVVVLLILHYDAEKRWRVEYKRYRGLQVHVDKISRVNQHLMDELQIFRGGTKSLDLATPYEKALSMLEDMRQKMAGKWPQESAELVSVIQLLASNKNMLKPDLDRQIQNGAALDKTTSDWLLTEIAPRDNRSEKSRGGGDFSVSTVEAFVASVPGQPSGSSTTLSVTKSTKVVRRSSASSIMPTLSIESERKLSEELSKIQEWDSFDIFKVATITNGHPLYFVGMALFQQNDLIDTFRLDQERLCNFLYAIEQAYFDNPYHNATHAADVTQSMNFLLNRGGPRHLLRNLDILAALLAAICHDAGHAGVNNAFEISTQSDRALIYNDRSVLESYHVSKCFMLLRNDKYNFLANMDPLDRKELRRIIISMVLSTDLSSHFEHLGLFKARAGSEEFGHSAEDRQIVLNLAIKCADVSNGAKKLPVYLQWAERVMEEFYRQGDLEKARSLAVSPWMDREDAQEVKCQLGFLDFICLPMYASWVGQFHDSQLVLDTAKANRQYWQDCADSGLTGPAFPGAPSGPSPSQSPTPSQSQSLYNNNNTPIAPALASFSSDSMASPRSKQSAANTPSPNGTNSAASRKGQVRSKSRSGSSALLNSLTVSFRTEAGLHLNYSPALESVGSIDTAHTPG
eukprot:CAMPEP_0184651034 /NCGR_PEP_ID=MMETSP0308-20130426/8591_1 /TAXON_ID=38269 /ORGANISM="Gloeochaete witrockiana, Strain SAG 46.84" /LENGTH=688 /DNA_ID=CAMNT_0027084951 /DNA_START=573 /DNA_END=2635 /DNA_ORIENTATION=+